MDGPSPRTKAGMTQGGSKTAAAGRLAPATIAFEIADHVWCYFDRNALAWSVATLVAFSIRAMQCWRRPRGSRRRRRRRREERGRSSLIRSAAVEGDPTLPTHRRGPVHRPSGAGRVRTIGRDQPASSRMRQKADPRCVARLDSKVHQLEGREDIGQPARQPRAPRRGRRLAHPLPRRPSQRPHCSQAQGRAQRSATAAARPCSGTDLSRLRRWTCWGRVLAATRRRSGEERGPLAQAAWPASSCPSLATRRSETTSMIGSWASIASSKSPRRDRPSAVDACAHRQPWANGKSFNNMRHKTVGKSRCSQPRPESARQWRAYGSRSCCHDGTLRTQLKAVNRDRGPSSVGVMVVR